MAEGGNIMDDSSAARLFKWRYRILVWRQRRLAAAKKRQPEATADLLECICRQLDRAIKEQAADRAYVLADLLKAAYGEALRRPQEPQKLMNMCIMALRRNQDSAAITLLEAYTPLIRQTQPPEESELLEHFILLAYIAKKLNREYILDKIIALIFDCLAEFGFSSLNAAASCRVLKAVGIIAVKNHDYNTFCRARRLVGKLLLEQREQAAPVFAELLLGWSHVILKRDYYELFVELRLLCFELKEDSADGGELFAAFCTAAIDFSLMIASNRAIKCGAPFMAMVMRLAEGERQAAVGAVHFAVRTARIAIDMHGIVRGFGFLYPLLEECRRLTAMLQRFASCDKLAGRRYLTLLIHELITLLLVAERLEHSPADQLLTQASEIWQRDFARMEEELSVAAVVGQLRGLLEERACSACLLRA